MKNKNKFVAYFFLSLFILVFSFQNVYSFINLTSDNTIYYSGSVSINALDEDTLLSLDSFLEKNENEKEGEFALISLYLPVFSLQITGPYHKIIFPKLDPLLSFHGTSKFILALALRI